MMNGMEWGMGWGMGFGWLFWLLIIGLVVFAVQRATAPRTNETLREREDALDILKKRYARGEITAEEFDEMRKRLS